MPTMNTIPYLPAELLDIYEVHNFRHAAEVLHTGCRGELDDLTEALLEYRLSIADITAPGGNESSAPKILSTLLRPKGWHETRIKGDLLITLEVYGAESSSRPICQSVYVHSTY